MKQSVSRLKSVKDRESIKIIGLNDFIQTHNDYYYWLIGFECKKAISLQKYLINDAIRDEVNHNAKTYVIVDEAEHFIVAYFSIRSTCIIRTLIDTGKNEKIVKSVMPCLEITKLCTNEQYLNFLENSQYNNSGVGTYVFFTFVVPVIVVLSSMVGFIGVILFAIHDKNEKVINAYRNHMGFETIEDDNAKIISMLKDTSFIVDEYSSDCKFMYQEVDEIIKKYEGGRYNA